MFKTMKNNFSSVTFWIILFILFLASLNAVEVTHPVFPQKVSVSKKVLAQAEEVLRIPDEMLDALNPPYACHRFVGCPNCDMGVQERSRNMEWDIQKPDQIQCKFCLNFIVRCSFIPFTIDAF